MSRKTRYAEKCFNIGNECLAAGHYAAAVKHHEEALSIMNKAYAADSIELFMYYNNTGLSQMYMQDYDNALHNLIMAKQCIGKKTQMIDPLIIGENLCNIGNVYIRAS